MGRGIDGSYRIFKSLVNIYERLEFVDLHCQHREIFYTMRNKLVLPTTQLFEKLSIFELINMVFLVWYGVFWTQPEDIGYAIGNVLKQVFGVTLEQFS